MARNLEERTNESTKESVILRPILRLWHALRPERLVLDNEQYAHVLDRKTGIVKLVEGPTRKNLAYDERVVKTENRLIVPENHFCVVSNPYDAQTGKVKFGEREIRKGPRSFAIRPGEKLEQSVRSEYVLTKYDALLIKALTDFDEHHAGEKFLVKGPQRYTPSKNEQVIIQTKATPLSDTDGIYVQNEDTGDVRLVKGPTDYFLQPNEKLFEKETTKDELAALGLTEQAGRSGVRILTRQAANTSFLHDKTRALVLELEDKEIVYLYDGSSTRIERGPQTIFVGEYERPKVLTLSGGKPIEPNALKVALLKLGPDFIYDQIRVRTKDNAQLQLDVTYKWSFRCDDLRKAFSIEDFVGYAAESLSSDIRSAAAKYDFEEFHANAIQYVKDAVFGKGTSRLFEENGLEIFGIDITAITPEDPKIADKLHAAIEKNMDIYCGKLVLKATLESERQEVEGRKLIEKERGELIESQLANKRKRVEEGAKIYAERERIQTETKAESIRELAEARTTAKRARLDTVIAALQHEGADRYLHLRRAEVFERAEKLVIVPTDTKIVLPYARDLEE